MKNTEEENLDSAYEEINYLYNQIQIAETIIPMIEMIENASNKEVLEANIRNDKIILDDDDNRDEIVEEAFIQADAIKKDFEKNKHLFEDVIIFGNKALEYSSDILKEKVEEARKSIAANWSKIEKNIPKDTLQELQASYDKSGGDTDKYLQLVKDMEAKK